MRRFILAVALMLGAAAGASALEPVNVTIDGVGSTDTVRGISIATQTPTNVIISTGPLYRQVCVQNFDTSAFLACGDSVLLSTQTALNNVGTLIAPAATATQPATPTCFGVPAGNPWYCLSSSVSAATRAGITRGR